MIHLFIIKKGNNPISYQKISKPWDEWVVVSREEISIHESYREKYICIYRNNIDEKLQSNDTYSNNSIPPSKFHKTKRNNGNYRKKMDNTKGNTLFIKPYIRNICNHKGYNRKYTCSFEEMLVYYFNIFIKDK